MRHHKYNMLLFASPFQEWSCQPTRDEFSDFKRVKMRDDALLLVPIHVARMFNLCDMFFSECIIHMSSISLTSTCSHCFTVLHTLTPHVQKLLMWRLQFLSMLLPPGSLIFCFDITKPHLLNTADSREGLF